MQDKSAVLSPRAWVPGVCEERVQALASAALARTPAQNADHIEALIARNRTIHEHDCFNLNPATNVMNPRAEAALASGLGSRPSLGYPGDKYEMGLEAIEEIEVIAAQLAAQVFQATHAEVRVASGAMANLYAFMACAAPGDTIIVPPASIAGHVTHHDGGCAGLFGLTIVEAPIRADDYTIDVEGLRALAQRVMPKMITVGGSLNLVAHPVAEISAIARDVGAKVLFDAAHQCGMIAGRAWPNPLDSGADLMTMSTYKSLGGPAAGLIVTRDGALAERLDAIAFPGMTANFDAAKTAALAITLLDWQDHGEAYAQAMVDLAQTLARDLEAQGLPVFKTAHGATTSHQFALEAAAYGGGQAAAKRLRQAGFLACGIGLPVAPVEGDTSGLRLGTPELVRWGMTAKDAPRLAALIARGLTTNDPASLADEVAAWRRSFDTLHFVNR
ncbi:MAG: aminotransferase class I/II-fold pyridoxal phosphate-dependent enzyme [Pseudomonadota bacterium]